ncbi:24753_t:CDS:2, partial [Gigaspora rosea]
CSWVNDLDFAHKHPFRSIKVFMGKRAWCTDVSFLAKLICENVLPNGIPLNICIFGSVGLVVQNDPSFEMFTRGLFSVRSSSRQNVPEYIP